MRSRLTRIATGGAAPKDDPDRELLQAVREEYPHGTRWFTEVVSIHWDRLWMLSQALLLDAPAAEEAAKQAFLRVHRRLESYRFEQRFASWMCLIALETSDEAHAAMQKDARPVGFGAAFGRMGAWVRGRAGRRSPKEPRLSPSEIFVRLDPLERRLLALQCLEGLSREEAAESLQLDPAEFDRRLEDARARLAALLGPAKPAGRKEPARPERSVGVLDARSAALVKAAIGEPDRERLVKAMDEIERQVVLEDLVTMLARSASEAALEFFDVIAQLYPARARTPAAGRSQGEST